MEPMKMAIDLPHKGIPELSKVLKHLEVQLSDAKARRDKIISTLDARALPPMLAISASGLR
jgi:hypothetical protein